MKDRIIKKKKGGRRNRGERKNEIFKIEDKRMKTDNLKTSNF